MGAKDADRIANSEDPDQTAPLGAVWSGSALFAKSIRKLGIITIQCLESFLSLWSCTRTVMKIQKLWTPKTIAVIILKFQRYGFSKQ